MDAKELVRVRRLAETGTARAIRLEAKLSYSEIAKAANVDRTTVFRWEHGQRRPRGEAALRYLAVLDALVGR